MPRTGAAPRSLFLGVVHLPSGEHRALTDMLASHRNGLKARSSLETRPSIEAPNPGAEEDSAPLMVHPSSTELFYFIGQNLEQCANLGRTGTGKALFDLLGIHKKWLKVYAEDVLLASMKKYRKVLVTTFVSHRPAPGPRPSFSPAIRRRAALTPLKRKTHVWRSIQPIIVRQQQWRSDLNCGAHLFAP